VQDRLVLQPGEVRVRHIKLGASTDPGAVQVLGTWFTPNWAGLNGRRGWISGSYERKTNDTAAFQIEFPNTAGEDGTEHRDRFLICQQGKRTPLAGGGLFGYGGGSYRPGDEWLEFWWRGELVYVGTPTKVQLGLDKVTLTGYDGLFLQKKQRELASGFWNHAPRDVFEYYTQAWQLMLAEGFDVPDKFVFSTSEQVTADGRLTYLRAGNPAGGTVLVGGATSGPIPTGAVRLAPAQPAVGMTSSAYVGGSHSNEFDYGPSSSNPRTSWRAETKLTYGPTLFYRIDASTTLSAAVALSVHDLTSGYELARLVIVNNEDGTAQAGAISGDHFLHEGGVLNVIDLYGTAGGQYTQSPDCKPGQEITLAIEGRGRWGYYYINGRLVGVLELFAPDNNGQFPSFNLVPWVKIGNGNPVATGNNAPHADVQYLTMRRTRPYLMRRSYQGGPGDGDLQLPGAPPAGGLLGNYMNDVDISPDVWTMNPPNIDRRKFKYFNPLKQPYARRIDPQVDVGGTLGPATPPYGPPNNATGPSWWGARWVGSVYLDFANTDYKLRTIADDRIRVWIGRTELATHRIEDWPAAGHPPATVNAGWLASAIKQGSLLGTAGATPSPGILPSGWYPIVIEYSNTGAPYQATLQLSTDGTNFFTVSQSSLSPVGIHDQQVRYESYFDQLAAIATTYGYQYTCTPQSLESGLFPGEVLPKLRVGRDTEMVVDTLVATDNLAVNIDAETTADLFMADAQGLGDTQQQLTAESLNYASEAPGSPFLLQEYDSLADISVPSLLSQRLDSMLALRGSAWEETTTDTDGKRQLLDQFPVGGAAAQFAWEPGDGVRLVLPEVAVMDANPRQVLGVTWPCYPDGLGRPSLSFKARPRDLPTMLRDMHRTTLQAIRNYQGQIVTYEGSVGSVGTSAGSDGYSRVAVPPDMGNIIRLELVVMVKGDASAWTFTLNGNAALTQAGVAYPGTYDLTPLLSFSADVFGGAAARIVVGASGGTSYIEWKAVAYVAR
jgi:hypothetical protein